MRNSCAVWGFLLMRSLPCTSPPQKEFRFLDCILPPTLGFYVELTSTKSKTEIAFPFADG
jgi:hypothetical protein